MTNKKIVIAMIIGVSLIAVVVLVMMFSKNDADNKKENNKEYTAILETDSEQDALEDEEECLTVRQQTEDENKKTDTETDGEECLTVRQSDEVRDESGVEATREEIEALELTVTDMNDEVRKEITDYDAFLYAIKECFYTMGVMKTEVQCLNQVTHIYADNLVVFSLYVNDLTVNYIDVVHDLTSDSYYVKIQ